MEAGPTAYHQDYAVDLRQCVRVVARRWWLIVLAMVLAAAGAFVVSGLQGPTYQATALVVIGKPRYVVNFDPRIEVLSDKAVQGSALATLATSDEVLTEVLDKVEDALPGDRRDLATLKAMVTAKAGRDPSLLKLTARGTNPKLAADIANVWAEALVVHANRVYGVGDRSVRFFEVEVARAKEKLDQAERALAAYQGQNELPVMEARYASLRSLQAQYLAEQRRIEGLLLDVATLRSQLDARLPTDLLTFDDQLAVLGLSLKSLNAEVSAPVQLQITDMDSLTGRTVSEALTYLNTLEENLRIKYADMDTRLTELGPVLQHLQERMERLRSKENQLVQMRDLARQTYVAMVRELEGARIVSQDSASRTRVASTAEIPERPVGTRRLVVATLAGVVGLMLGLGAAFFLEFLEAEPQASPSRDEVSFTEGTTLEA